MAGLTDKQRAVLVFLVTHWSQHQRFPTADECCERFGWSSRNAWAGHMTALAKKGFVRLAGEGKARAVELVGLDPSPAAGAYLERLKGGGG